MMLRLPRILIGLLWLLPLSVAAELGEASQAEVAYLLNLVKHTPCAIIRNGKRYDGVAGYDHIQRKYQHFRQRITSTEEFIALSAAKSTISGKHYFVQCGATGEKVRTQDWLLRELSLYRSNRS